MTNTDDLYDELLADHAAFSPIVPPGVSDHGPMVIDELVDANLDDLVRRWHGEYVQLLDTLPPRVRDVELARATDALGDASRIADWIGFFEAAIDAAPWEDIVREWLPTLLPGMFTDIGHGPIRVAHIVRRLERRATSPRSHELAVALGAWAATYTELPAAADSSRTDDAFVDLSHRLSPDDGPWRLVGEQVAATLLGTSERSAAGGGGSAAGRRCMR